MAVNRQVREALKQPMLRCFAGFCPLLSRPKTPSAPFYKHLRPLSAPLFTATVDAFQPERTVLAPESAIWLSQITPADTCHSP